MIIYSKKYIQKKFERRVTFWKTRALSREIIKVAGILAGQFYTIYNQLKDDHFYNTFRLIDLIARYVP